MNTETEQKPDNEVKLCCWCGRSLDLSNTVKERVCVRCYELLTNAGIKDEEICSNEKKQS